MALKPFEHSVQHLSNICVGQMWKQFKRALTETCPEMYVIGMHELYERHHKVSPDLNSH